MIIMADGTVFQTPTFDGPELRYEYKGANMRLSPVIAVYDKKVGLFDPPFIVRHNGEAVREFGLVKKNTETKFGKNPEDFELFQIANYNETLGSFENLTQHVHLDSGV